MRTYKELCRADVARPFGGRVQERRRLSWPWRSRAIRVSTTRRSPTKSWMATAAMTARSGTVAGVFGAEPAVRARCAGRQEYLRQFGSRIAGHIAGRAATVWRSASPTGISRAQPSRWSGSPIPPAPIEARPAVPGRSASSSNGMKRRSCSATTGLRATLISTSAVGHILLDPKHFVDLLAEECPDTHCVSALRRNLFQSNLVLAAVTNVFHIFDGIELSEN